MTYPYIPTVQPVIPQQLQPVQQQTNQGGLKWVQGEAGAKAYLVTSASSPVVLFDTEAQTIYIKSLNSYGQPTYQTLDYTIREQNPQIQQPQPVAQDYVTKSDLNEFKDSIASLIDEKLSYRKPKPKKEGDVNGKSALPNVQ